MTQKGNELDETPFKLRGKEELHLRTKSTGAKEEGKSVTRTTAGGLNKFDAPEIC